MSEPNSNRRNRSHSPRATGTQNKSAAPAADGATASDKTRTPIWKPVVILGVIVSAAAASLIYYWTPRQNEHPATTAIETTPDWSDGHARMTAILAKVAEDAKSNNEYFRTSGIEEMTARLELGTNVGREELFDLNLQLGRLHLNQGNNAKAVVHLEQVYRMASRVVASLTPEQQKEQLGPLLMELAVAHLRVGEAQNCIHCQTGESCILPIRESGIHEDKSGSTEAIKYLTKLLQLNPRNMEAAWLLNIAYMTLGQHERLRASDYFLPLAGSAEEVDFPEFTDVARERGVAEFSCSGGSSAEDFDGDGDIDWIVSNWDVNGQLKVFLNQGDGTFADFTSESGTQGITGGLNLIHADYDNDGDVDLYVLRGAWQADVGKIPNSLLQNDGSARFRDVTFESGLGESPFPTQTAAFADYDNDGDLDLFVGNENFPCNLFENNGQGSFTDVAGRAGVSECGYPKGVTWGDYDNDRWPDLFISNIAGENFLYHNHGDGTFENVAQSAKVTEPLTSFPAWFWDYDNDGNLDIFVSSYKAGIKYVAAEYFGLPLSDQHFPRLYRGDGRGGFVDQSEAVGLHSVMQPMGANFGDLDNDGYLDFFLGTGYIDYSGLMPNRLMHNVAGKAFEDVTIPARVGHLQKGHGVAFADFDEDGDQDLLIEIGGAFAGDAFRNALFENPGFQRNHIKLKLVGGQSNRSAIGARIRVDVREGDSSRSIYRTVGTGGSFGANPLEQHIGIGTADKVQRLEIYWPMSDTTQVFDNLEANQRYLVSEGEMTVKKVTASIAANPDASPVVISVETESP